MHPPFSRDFPPNSVEGIRTCLDPLFPPSSQLSPLSDLDEGRAYRLLAQYAALLSFRCVFPRMPPSLSLGKFLLTRDLTSIKVQAPFSVLVFWSSLHLYPSLESFQFHLSVVPLKIPSRDLFLPERAFCLRAFDAFAPTSDAVDIDTWQSAVLISPSVPRPLQLAGPPPPLPPPPAMCLCPH